MGDGLRSVLRHRSVELSIIYKTGVMQYWEASVLLNKKLLLGEGAGWIERERRWVYVDIENKMLGFYDPVSGDNPEMIVDARVGVAVPAADGGYLLAMQGRLAVYDPGRGITETLAGVEGDQPFLRCNDGACDARGRFWFGVMHVDGVAEAGALYRYDGQLTKIFSGHSVPNGICWNRDSSVMYYIDSYDRNIKAFEYDIESGVPGDHRVAVQIEDPDVLPDGMSIDEAGMLWVAIWGGYGVHRYDPVSGKLIGKVMVPAPNVTNVAFGGKGFGELMITTAREGLDADQLAKFPLSGSIFTVSPGVRGVADNLFQS